MMKTTDSKAIMSFKRVDSTWHFVPRSSKNIQSENSHSENLVILLVLDLITFSKNVPSRFLSKFIV